MPGYAGWKQLYQEEYFQMREEGFDLTGVPAPEEMLFQLPLPVKPGEQAAAPENEPVWEQAYRTLWKRYAEGVSPEYPYVEPNRLEDIF